MTSLVHIHLHIFSSNNKNSTAIGMAAKLMGDMGLLKHYLGQLICCAAMIDDVASLVKIYPLFLLTPPISSHFYISIHLVFNILSSYHFDVLQIQVLLAMISNANPNKVIE
jgi:Kef-type K+ transport system membrane component KefB